MKLNNFLKNFLISSSINLKEDQLIKTDEVDTNNSPINEKPSNIISIIEKSDKDNTENNEGKFNDGVKKNENRFFGVMDNNDIQIFLRHNFYGRGIHDGSIFRSLNSKELGMSSIITQFQNILNQIITQKTQKINQIEDQLTVVSGTNDNIVSRLKLACNHLENEIQILSNQIELSQNKKGWVLDALNRYLIGFDKGLKEVIEIELLLG